MENYCCMLVRKCYYISVFLFLPVATPVVTITRDPLTGTLYVGGNVTLKCLIRLDNTVDSSVTVTVVWSTSDGY